jgi:glycosyltransferase
MDHARSFRLRKIATGSHGIRRGRQITSTVGTGEILRKYSSKISSMMSESDFGIYDAMSKGLPLAIGGCMEFLNSDDFYYSDEFVTLIAQSALSASNPEAIYGDLVCINQHNIENVIRCWRSGQFTRHKFRLGWMLPHNTFLHSDKDIGIYG